MRIPHYEVASMLRELAVEIVLPGFRTLEANDIAEKAPGEIVTVVDRRVEEALAPRLVSLLPDSRVVGEEATAGDTSLLQNLEQGLVWLLDPLDGTSNFAHQREDFSMMVALLDAGETIASWIYAPLTDTLASAIRGSGAFVGRERVHTKVDDTAGSGVVKTRFLPLELRHALESSSLPFADGSGSAGIDYPELVRGRWSFLMYWRTLPWDHAPGALFVQEAGGHVARLDGSPYRAADQRRGLLIAPSYNCWLKARAVLPT